MRADARDIVLEPRGVVLMPSDSRAVGTKSVPLALVYTRKLSAACSSSSFTIRNPSRISGGGAPTCNNHKLSCAVIADDPYSACARRSHSRR